jgi:hypothetical protein
MLDIWICSGMDKRWARASVRQRWLCRGWAPRSLDIAKLALCLLAATKFEIVVLSNMCTGKSKVEPFHSTNSLACWIFYGMSSFLYTAVQDRLPAKVNPCCFLNCEQDGRSWTTKLLRNYERARAWFCGKYLEIRLNVRTRKRATKAYRISCSTW